MKLQITRIYTSTTDKNKNPLMTKDGRPYTRIAILTKEKGDKTWISGFLSEWNRDWKVGMEVEAEVFEKDGFWNMKRLDPIKALEERVVRLEDAVFSDKSPGYETEDEVRDEDIPF